MFATLNYTWSVPPVRDIQNLDRISQSNVLGLFEVCLELLSDSSDQFGFVVDKSSELVHTRKSLCSQHLICRYTRQSETEVGNNFSFKRSGIIRSLFIITKYFSSFL